MVMPPITDGKTLAAAGAETEEGRRPTIVSAPVPRRLNSSSVLVAARLRPRTNCASLAKRIARQAFLEGSGRSCAVRGSIPRL